MAIESTLSKNNPPLNVESLSENLPEEIFIKLKNYPILAEGANRRIICTNFAGNLRVRFKSPLIEGYTISDWKDNKYKARKYFSIEELNSLT